MWTGLKNILGNAINPATEEKQSTSNTSLSSIDSYVQELQMIKNYLMYLVRPSWMDATTGRLNINTVTTVSTVTTQTNYTMPGAGNTNAMQAQIYPEMNTAWVNCVRNMIT